MSFGVCRVEKIKGAAAVAGLQIHNNRERMHSNTNPDIDRSRSELNYSLIKQDTHNYNKLIEERLQQGYKGKKAIRKDAVKMCEMLFTSDGDFFSRLSESEQQQFFLDCFEFAAQRYGRENIIAATVHLDEATPHMHLDFVPLTSDGRLSAKDILGGRKEMQQLQDDFYSTVSSKYGLERGSRADLESGEHSRKHLETAEYKEKLARDRTKQAEQTEQIAHERIQAANQAAAEAERIAADQQQKAEKHQRKRKELKAKKQAEQAELAQLEQQKKDLQEEIERQETALQAEKRNHEHQIESLEEKMAQAESRLKALQGQVLTAEEVKRINAKKSLTGALKGITYEDYLNLKATAERVDQAEQIFAEIDKMIAKAKSEAEQVIAKARSEAEMIVSDAKSKSEKELEEFHRYKRWAKNALDEYVEQSDKKDEMTKQAEQRKKALTDLQGQISSAEQEIEKLKKEIDKFNKTLEQLTQNQDDRYCSFRIESSLLFAKLMETAQEYRVAVRMEKSADGTTIVKAPVSEKKYLALAIEKAKKLLPPKPEHQEQTQVVQPSRRRGPHL